MPGTRLPGGALRARRARPLRRLQATRRAGVADHGGAARAGRPWRGSRAPPLGLRTLQLGYVAVALRRAAAIRGCGKLVDPRRPCDRAGLVHQPSVFDDDVRPLMTRSERGDNRDDVAERAAVLPRELLLSDAREPGRPRRRREPFG